MFYLQIQWIAIDTIFARSYTNIIKKRLTLSDFNYSEQNWKKMAIVSSFKIKLDKTA